MAILTYSPHLWGTLERLFSREELRELEASFEAAMLLGGMDEADFVRPAAEGAHNPRPARVALVLIQNADLKDVKAIGAAMIAAVSDAQPKSNPARVDDTVSAYVRCALLPAGDLENGLPSTRVPAVINCAVWLDRARHFHRSERKDEHEVAIFLEETKKRLALARKVCPEIAKLLEQWIERFVTQSKIKQGRKN